MRPAYYANKHDRIPELDLLKTIAVIGMVFVHVFEVPAALDTSSPIAFACATIIEFFGCIPSAGIFMFCMGWGAALSVRSTALTYVDRFLQLAILGIVVNFFQQLVPMLMDPADFGVASENLFALIAVDIYQFAALGMVYFAIMQILGKNTKPAIVVSGALVAVCAVVNACFSQGAASTGNDWLDTLVGYVIHVNEYSYFPFISWLVFPAAGYATAYLHKRIRDKKWLPFATIGVGAVLIVVAEVLMNAFGVTDVVIRHVYPPEEGYYLMHPLCALCGFGIIAVEFSLACLILRALKGRLGSFFEFVSMHVMFIYVTQWIVIGCLTAALYRMTSLWANMLTALLVLVAACMLAWLNDATLKKMPESARISASYHIR